MRRKYLRKKMCSAVLVGSMVVATPVCVMADDYPVASAVLDEVAEATGNIQSMMMDGTLDISASIVMGEGDAQSTLAITAGGDIDVEYLVDPVNSMPTLGMTMNINLNALGQSQGMDMKMFLEPESEDGYHMAMYMRDGGEEEGEWDYDYIYAEDLGNINENQSAGLSILEDYGISFENKGLKEVNGEGCYELASTLTFNDVMKAAEKINPDISEEYEETLDSDELTKSVLDALKLSIRYYVGQDYVPTRVEVDLNDSDFTVINDIIVASLGEEGDYSVDISNVSFVADLAYDTIDSVSIAEEARAQYEVKEAEEETTVGGTVDLESEIKEGTSDYLSDEELDDIFNETKYLVGEDIEPGAYIFYQKNADYTGFISVYEDYDEENIIAAESVVNNLMYEAKEGEYLVVSGCDFEPYTDEDKVVFPGEGMFEVGKHIEAGEYIVTTLDDNYGGYWCIYNDMRLQDIVENSYFEDGESIINVEEGQFLIIDNCEFS